MMRSRDIKDCDLLLNCTMRSSMHPLILFKLFVFILKKCLLIVGFLVAQMVKNLSAMQETCVQSLGQEDPLEKEMATHSSILARRIPRTEEPGSPWGCKESDTTEWPSLTHSLTIKWVNFWKICITQRANIFEKTNACLSKISHR